jgi:hypothetical protein
MLKYMEKELGKRAAEEMNIPALKSWNTSQDRPMCTPNSLQTPLLVKNFNEIELGTVLKVLVADIFYQSDLYL